MIMKAIQSLFALLSPVLLLTPLTVSAHHYPSPERKMVPLVQACQTPGMVALTFDDGPSDNFDLVLNTLDSHDTKATFFLVGKKLEQQHHVDRALQAIQDGHQIENHSWEHPDFLTLSNEEIKEQVILTNEILWEKLGVIPRFVRPPHGRIDVPSAMPVWDQGYGIALWNLDPIDYRSTYIWGPTQVFNKIKDAFENASPTNDSFVILLHDFSETSATRLGDIITLIKQKGYSLVTLDECVLRSGH